MSKNVVTCLFAVAEAELALMLGAVAVPVGPITELNPGSAAEVPRFTITITNLTARVERSSGI